MISSPYPGRQRCEGSRNVTGSKIVVYSNGPYCWVFEFLRRSVVGNNVQAFSEWKAILKFLQSGEDELVATPLARRPYTKYG